LSGIVVWAEQIDLFRRCRFSLRETKKLLELRTSPRNLEQITQNTGYASICGFLGDIAHILSHPACKKSPNRLQGASTGDSKRAVTVDFRVSAETFLTLTQ
jgi:hypothetical protein